MSELQNIKIELKTENTFCTTNKAYVLCTEADFWVVGVYEDGSERNLCKCSTERSAEKEKARLMRRHGLN